MTTLEGNALRRAVYEARGWAMVDADDDNDPHYDLLMPGGRPYAPVYVSGNIDDAWDFILQQTYAHLHDYAHDLNTIKDAPLDEDVSVEICNPLPYDRRREWDVAMTTETGESYRASHSEPATAFWNAWIEMRKSIGGDR